MALDSTTSTLRCYSQDNNGNAQLVGSFAVSTTVASATVIAYLASRPFGDTDTGLPLAASARDFSVRDLRLRNKVKSVADTGSVPNYQPQTTPVQYPLGRLPLLHNHDHYGMRVLETGLVAPVALPPWYQQPRLAQVVRYNSLGQYSGDSRFKKIGLGGGQAPPATFQLGNQFFKLTAAGTLPVSTSIGDLPGVNSIWLKDTAPGSCIVLNGSTSSVSIAVVTASGTSNPWPSNQVATNPYRNQYGSEAHRRRVRDRVGLDRHGVNYVPVTQATANAAGRVENAQ